MKSHPTTDYSIDYFIEKFTQIPAEKWITSRFSDEFGNHCAAGHCGCKSNDITEEGNRLVSLFSENGCNSAAYVNDGHHIEFQQDNPKDRILAALHFIKLNQRNKK